MSKMIRASSFKRKKKPITEDESAMEKRDADIVPETIDFDTSLLPEDVRAFSIDIAERMDHAPISFSAVSTMMVLSASIGRSVGVRVKQNDTWTEVPNLWGALIAPPSIKKSPILKEVVKPLRMAEGRSNDAHKEAMSEYAGEMILYEIEMKQYKKYLERGDGEPKSCPVKPEMPTRKRYLIQDATIEAVVEIMVDNPKGLLVLLDELSGFFATLRMHGRDRDRSFWLEAFSVAQNVMVDRIQRGNFMVPYVCAGVFGTIQPDKISPLIDDSKSGGGGGDGLLQRFQMMIWEDSPHYTYTDRQPDRPARDRYYALIEKMIDADPVDYGAYKDEYSDEYYFQFSPGATKIYKQWSDKNQKKIEIESEHNIALSAHFGKYPGLFASIALILFYSDRISGLTEEKYIPEDYAIKAGQWCEFLEKHARKIYDIQRLREERMDSLHEKIIGKVKDLSTMGKLPLAFGGISKQIRGATARDVEDALKGLAVINGRKVFGLR